MDPEIEKLLDVGAFYLNINPLNTGWLQVESRTRYNMWDLVEDVGGFNDGLILICSLFMSFYAAFAFKADYLDGQFIDTSSETAQSKRNRFAP